MRKGKDELAKRAEMNRIAERQRAKELITKRRGELALLEAEGKVDPVLAQQVGEALYDYDRGAYWSAIGQVSDEGIRFARTIA